MFDKDDSNEILQKTCSQDVIIFAVPFSSLENAIKMTKLYIEENTLIIDVSSIKEKPLILLQRNFPKNPIIGTHPMFWPESWKGWISNLPIVTMNISAPTETYTSLQNFLSKKLKLRLIEKTAEEHDKEMAYVQWLSHFIGRALNHLNIKDSDIATSSYKHLLTLKNLLKNDSWALFETIENWNNYTAELRLKFMKELEEIENKLWK